MENTNLTEQQILDRAREARIKKLSKPKSVLALQPRMMGQCEEIRSKQREARG